jgi:chitin disaccharide deacetylase
MNTPRALVVVADDFGIGPQTTRGILELATAGVLSGTVLLVNSPHAESAVASWRAAGKPIELGWHPCLTMDPPAAPVDRVRSLVDANGQMWPLGRFLARLLLGLVRAEHLRTELQAQYERFIALTGQAPRLVNSHQHVALFGPVGAILREVLRRQPTRPYLRRVREPVRTLWRIPGAWIKRVGLSTLGRIQARAQDREGFPGAGWLAGITDPAWIKDPAFFERWLNTIAGPSVELMVHPGYFDETLIGRDCRADDGLQQRRVDELDLLRRPAFLDACRGAGFGIMTPHNFDDAHTKVHHAA